MARPFLNASDVAKLGGVTAETVSRYLQRSKPADPESGRVAGPYVNDPFPRPDDYNGRWPWWSLEREQEIRAWFERRSDRTGVGGRPPKAAGQG